MYLSPGRKIQIMVTKYWLSVKNMRIWCKQFKKNWAQLDDPSPSYSKPHGLQMTIIFQNYQNYLKIKNFCIEKNLNYKWIDLGLIYSCPSSKLKSMQLEQSWVSPNPKNGQNHVFVCQYHYYTISQFISAA